MFKTAKRYKNQIFIGRYFSLTKEKITGITMTTVPSHYHKMVGQPAFADDIGNQATECFLCSYLKSNQLKSKWLLVPNRNEM